MEQEVEVDGKTAVVRTEEVGKCRWTWTFWVDDHKGLRRGNDRPVPDEQIALNEGVDAARRALTRAGP